MAVIDEPASAVAAGLCLTARAVDRDARTTRHPRRCSWCDWPAEQLRSMVDGFNAWAGFDERSGTYERHSARVFAELPRDQQLRLVVEAQGIETEPAANRPADDVSEEEAVPWM